jgi:hypothetical protein
VWNWIAISLIITGYLGMVAIWGRWCRHCGLSDVRSLAYAVVWPVSAGLGLILVLLFALVGIPNPHSTKGKSNGEKSKTDS